MDPFQRYASLYDLINGGKDYRSEVGFVARQLGAEPGARLVDLGCGTGGHALLLAENGFHVTGIDQSAQMIARAQARQAAQSAEVQARLHFQVGTLQEFAAGAPFDAAVSLFHVVSYQTTNAQVQRAFHSIRSHLRPGGLFLFDYWHGPGVLSDLPAPRERIMENADLRVTRQARPETLTRQNLVIVRYAFEVEEKASGARESFPEVHHMRYFFEPELELMLEAAGFRIRHSVDGLAEQPPTTAAWTAWTLAEAV